MTEKKPSIKIIATGGTIASKAKSPTQSTDYSEIGFDANELIDCIPGIRNEYDLDAEQIFKIDSSQVEDHHLLTLSHRVNEILADPAVDGVVITHGTDTMEETAFFLNLTVKSKKPVVLTGSMRPPEVVSADGAGNLLCAIKAAGAKESYGKGVLVAIENRLWPARDVTKMSTYHTDAFGCPEYGPLGTVIDEVRFDYVCARPHTADSEFDVRGLSALPTVRIVYQHVDSKDTMFRCAVETKPDGIVLACVGNGTVPPEMKSAIFPTPERPFVVRASRVTSGMICPCGHVSDEEYKLIPSGGFNPQKSRILLQLALTKTKDYKEICRIFNRY